MSVREAVFAVAELTVQALGFQIVDVEYLKEGSSWVVRVYLFKEEGVSLDDCKLASHALGDALEAADPVKTPYHLEVSSPGAERVLKHEREYRLFQGRWVRATLKQADAAGNFHLFGRLGPTTAETVTLAPPADAPPLALLLADIKQLRLALASDVPGASTATRSGSK